MKYLALLFALIFQAQPSSAADYHLVGWVNTFVPGGGELLLGNYTYAGIQAALEVGTFYPGYRMSARDPLTLDGVPESLPSASSSFITSTKTKWVCNYNNATHKCVWVKESSSSTVASNNLGPPVDLTQAIYADWLQEFGIKYHMVNVFNAYRSAAKSGGTAGSQKIDQTSTGELFLAPFLWDNFTDPWVFFGIIVSAGALIYNYNSLINNNGITASPALTQKSQSLYDATYLGVFPVGSGAPEEMFYRGFLQHEFYSWVPSPFFSIGLSTTAYTFSHSGDDRPSAAITGAFLGMLTHINQGKISKSIAYHFWSDVLAGIYQVSIVRKSTGHMPLVNLSFKF